VLLAEVKALQAELADRERSLAAVENALHEQSAETSRIRNDAAQYTQQLQDLERRLDDRSNQICELRNVVQQQKDLIHEAQEQSDFAHEHVRELQKSLVEKDKQHALAIQEREDAIMKAANRRLEAVADDHQRDLQRKDEDAQKLRKKLRKMEAQLQKAKERYDEKVCEFEEISNILEEQKVESMRFMLRAQQGGGGVGGSGDSTAQMFDVQDQQEVIQSTLQRAKDEQRKKKDRFAMGETTSALSQVRAAGNAVNLVKKMGLIVAHPPPPPNTTSGGGGGQPPPQFTSPTSQKRGSSGTRGENWDDDEDETY
jgi:DNA repair exonuclease SbcCD ATPase subunit